MSNHVNIIMQALCEGKSFHSQMRNNPHVIAAKVDALKSILHEHDQLDMIEDVDRFISESVDEQTTLFSHAPNNNMTAAAQTIVSNDSIPIHIYKSFMESNFNLKELQVANTVLRRFKIINTIITFNRRNMILSGFNKENTVFVEIPLKLDSDFSHASVAHDSISGIYSLNTEISFKIDLAFVTKAKARDNNRESELNLYKVGENNFSIKFSLSSEYKFENLPKVPKFSPVLAYPYRMTMNVSFIQSKLKDLLSKSISSSKNPDLLLKYYKDNDKYVFAMSINDISIEVVKSSFSNKEATEIVIQYNYFKAALVSSIKNKSIDISIAKEKSLKIVAHITPRIEASIYIAAIRNGVSQENPKKRSLP